MSSDRRVVVACSLAIAWFAVLGCDAATSGTADASLAVCEPGQQLPCACEDGASGSALCDASGRLARCACEPARTIPCSAPGHAFACRCTGGDDGTQVCLSDGRYTDCECTAAAGGDGRDAGDEPDVVPDAEGGLEVAECPSGYGCVEQMGYQVCADSTGVPPLCSARADCAAVGLPDAACLDPGAGGVMLCVQACRL